MTNRRPSTAGGNRPHERAASLIRRVHYTDTRGVSQLARLCSFYGEGISESAVMRRAIGFLAAEVARIEKSSDAALATQERGQALAYVRPSTDEKDQL